MTADRLTAAVRRQLDLGRLLPLGGPADGAWISERAAGAVLRRAAQELRGVRLDTLRIALTDPEDELEPSVPPPPGALPPGLLRVTADCAMTAAEPLPTAVERLRTLLATTATQRLGLIVAEVDLRVTALLDEEEAGEGGEREEGAGGAEAAASAVRPPAPAPAGAATDPDEVRAAAAATGVPGVTGLTGSLGGVGRPVHIEALQHGMALPRRHVRVELAVSAGHRAVDVALGVRAAVSEALPDRPTVAVLVTAVS
jgi:hypothetical protein